MRGVRDYTFESAVHEWSKPPVDGVGYIPSGAMLKMSDKMLLELIEMAREERYSTKGWRNYHGLWKCLLGLTPSTKGKRILDFGCGIGLDAIQFAKNDNQVVLADICSNNIALAQRVLSLYGHESEKVKVGPTKPFFQLKGKVDVFYASGVLHHIPEPRPIPERACEVLRPGGEIRAMLYSDKGYKIAVGRGPEPGRACDHPHFKKFVAYFDGVGDYADWYNATKLEELFGDFLDIVGVYYITRDDRYLVALMRPKK